MLFNHYNMMRPKGESLGFVTSKELVITVPSYSANEQAKASARGSKRESLSAKVQQKNCSDKNEVLVPNERLRCQLREEKKYVAPTYICMRKYACMCDYFCVWDDGVHIQQHSMEKYMCVQRFNKKKEKIVRTMFEISILFIKDLCCLST